MKKIENSAFQELSSEENLNITGGGLIVFFFIAGLAVAYYEQRVKDQ